MSNYILQGKVAVQARDIIEWAKWYETASRRVANWEQGGVRVSTVFLSIDHSFGGGPPQLFETMVFGGDLDGEQDRYSTWEQAEAGHVEMVNRVTKTKGDSNADSDSE